MTTHAFGTVTSTGTSTVTCGPTRNRGHPCETHVRRRRRTPTAPAGHQADVAHRLPRRGRQVPPGTKQCISSSAVVPDGARRPSGRRGAPSRSARPPGAPRHQAAYQLLRCHPQRRPPAIRPTWRTVSPGAATRCPKAPSNAPAPPLSSPTAPAGHQANAARRLDRHGRPVPEGTKQRTISCTVVPNGARRPSGRRGAPSRLARPLGAPRHQATHHLLRCRSRRRPPAIRPTRRTVSIGMAARCPKASH
jgi:hypothetical protein